MNRRNRRSEATSPRSQAPPGNADFGGSASLPPVSTASPGDAPPAFTASPVLGDLPPRPDLKSEKPAHSFHLLVTSEAEPLRSFIEILDKFYGTGFDKVRCQRVQLIIEYCCSESLRSVHFMKEAYDFMLLLGLQSSWNCCVMRFAAEPRNKWKLPSSATARWISPIYLFFI